MMMRITHLQKLTLDEDIDEAPIDLDDGDNGDGGDGGGDDPKPDDDSKKTPAAPPKTKEPNNGSHVKGYCRRWNHLPQ